MGRRTRRLSGVDSAASASGRPPAGRRALGDRLLARRKPDDQGLRRLDVKIELPSPTDHGRNMYSYCKSKPGALDRVPIDSLSPARFWKEYICPRRPVVIVGHPDDPAWTASKKWTDDYLVRQAGDCELRIEVREDAGDAYGRDNKCSMPFHEFVTEVSKGNPLLYLTTQEVSAAPDGFPQLHTEPVSRLIGDIPLRPHLLGPLVPQSINLWMGCSPEGSSSGLHHDFHDNLYILLRGRKRFRLYSPDMAGCMYTNGRLKAVHANGRIVYEGDGDIRADGADAHDAAAWEARHRAEVSLERLENEGGDGDEGADDALDRMLANALGDGDGELLLPEDDYVDSGDEGHSDELDPNDRQGKSSEPCDPPSFSGVDLRRDDWDLQSVFPLFPGKAAAAVAEVRAGEMLYLPCGWFHEVTSTGTPGSGGHLALNYWMHPPDNLRPSHAGFSAPYQNPLWPALWEKRTKQQLHGRSAGCAAPPAESKSSPPPSVRTTTVEKGSGCPLGMQKKRRRKSENGRATASESPSHGGPPWSPSWADSAHNSARLPDGHPREHSSSRQPGVDTVSRGTKHRKKKGGHASFGDVGSWFACTAGSVDARPGGFGTEDVLLDRLMSATQAEIRARDPSGWKAAMENAKKPKTKTRKKHGGLSGK